MLNRYQDLNNRAQLHKNTLSGIISQTYMDYYKWIKRKSQSFFKTFRHQVCLLLYQHRSKRCNKLYVQYPVISMLCTNDGTNPDCGWHPSSIRTWMLCIIILFKLTTRLLYYRHFYRTLTLPNFLPSQNSDKATITTSVCTLGGSFTFDILHFGDFRYC